MENGQNKGHNNDKHTNIPASPEKRGLQGNAPQRKPADRSEFAELIHELFSSENMRVRIALFRMFLRNSLHSLGMRIFYARERILCGVVCTVLMIFLAMLQTTVFSKLQPFGAIPDMMLSFVLALSITEGRKWGAVWGIIAAVVIESLGVPEIVLLPLLYMPVGYFGGVLCRHYFTGSIAVRAVMSVSVLPLRGVFTALYTVFSSVSASAGELFYEIILPEAAATLLLAAPVHILVYVCLRPFHRTRAEKVSDL